MAPILLSSPSSLLVLLLIPILHVVHCLAQVNPRQSCSSGYQLCSPTGASLRDVPEIGPGLARLYLNLIVTVNPQPAQVNGPSSVSGSVPAHRPRQFSGPVCCAPTTQCLLVLSYNIPICWDRFTTNYYLPDGSYGSITSGNYTTSAGDRANLITGNYQLANGTTGNIYQGDMLDEPDTSTLTLPTPFTSSGVGSAIPASEVGGPASFTSSSMLVLSTQASDSTTTASTSSGNISSLSGSTARGIGTATITSMTASTPDITPPITNSAFRTYHMHYLLHFIVVAACMYDLFPQ